MEKVVKFPYSLEEVVAVSCCIGPNRNDVRIREGIVKKLSVVLIDGEESIQVTIEFSFQVHYTHVIGNNLSSTAKIYPSVEKAISELNQAGYKIKGVERLSINREEFDPDDYEPDHYNDSGIGDIYHDS